MVTLLYNNPFVDVEWTRQGAYQHPIWFSSTGITELVVDDTSIQFSDWRYRFRWYRKNTPNHTNLYIL